MDMTPQTAWLIAISAVVIVGVVAFFIGRSTAGTKGRIDELEAERPLAAVVAAERVIAVALTPLNEKTVAALTFRMID